MTTGPLIVDGHEVVFTADGPLVIHRFGDKDNPFVVRLKPNEALKAKLKEIMPAGDETLDFPTNYPRIKFLQFLMLREFFSFVYEQHQSEAIALFHWDEATNDYTIVIPMLSEATSAHVKYRADVDSFCQDCFVGDPGTPDACSLCGSTRMTKFVLAGTSHSHGSMNAFHSSTDDENELVQTGFHITIGKVDQKAITACPSFVAAVPGTTTKGKGVRFLPDLTELVEAPFSETTYALFAVWSSLITSKNSMAKVGPDAPFLRSNKGDQYLVHAGFTQDRLEEISKRFNARTSDDSASYLKIVTKSTLPSQTATPWPYGQYQAHGHHASSSANKPAGSASTPTGAPSGNGTVVGSGATTAASTAGTLGGATTTTNCGGKNDKNFRGGAGLGNTGIDASSLCQRRVVVNWDGRNAHIYVYSTEGAIRQVDINLLEILQKSSHKSLSEKLMFLRCMAVSVIGDSAKYLRLWDEHNPWIQPLYLVMQQVTDVLNAKMSSTEHLDALVSCWSVTDSGKSLTLGDIQDTILESWHGQIIIPPVGSDLKSDQISSGTTRGNCLLVLAALHNILSTYLRLLRTNRGGEGTRELIESQLIRLREARQAVEKLAIGVFKFVGPISWSADTVAREYHASLNAQFDNCISPTAPSGQVISSKLRKELV